MKTVEETRLEKLIELVKQNKSQKAVAEKLERSASQVGQYTGGHRKIGEDFARHVEATFGMPVGWMDQPTNELSTPTDADFALVPQLDISASCGTGHFVDHVVVKGGLAFKKSSLRDFGVPEASARIIYASGGSMEPTIQDGCVVLINMADTTPREGRVYAICQPDGSLVLKRLVQDFIPALGAQGWIMRSDNPNKTQHADKMLPPDDRTMIVGRAVWNDNKL
jgi:phage repressor protein C with HTH and peptisase S24 domain